MSEVVTRLDRVSWNAKTREEKERGYQTDLPDGKIRLSGVLTNLEYWCFFLSKILALRPISGYPKRSRWPSVVGRVCMHTDLICDKTHETQIHAQASRRVKHRSSMSRAVHDTANNVPCCSG